MDNNSHEIALKARDIAKKIGLPIIRETYYTDYKAGSRYKYGELEIDYYDHDTNIVIVYVNKTQLFEYDFVTDKATCRSGKWTDIIDMIYQKIPDILKKREIERENKKQKINELKSLEDIFKYYIKCPNKDFVNSKLEEYSISIVPQERSREISAPYNEYPSYSTYAVNLIYYQGEKVAEFKDNEFDVFPNIDYYASKYQSGEWVDILKDVIKQAKDYDEEVIEDDITKLIKKLKKEQ